MAFHIYQNDDGSAVVADGERGIVAFTINADGSVVFAGAITAASVTDVSEES